MYKKKKSGIAKPVPDKIDFKTKVVTRNKEGHFIILKGVVQQEDIILVSIHEPNTGAP